MSKGRCGSSRTLGPYKQCAIYERAKRRCAWCGRKFGSADEVASGKAALPWEKASIDHLDGNPRNNDDRNLTLACLSCNSVRGWPAGVPWSRDRASIETSEYFKAFIAAKTNQRVGAAFMAAIQRVCEQRATALDRKAAIGLAELLHGVYLDRRRQRDRDRQKRRYSERKYLREERRAIQDFG